VQDFTMETLVLDGRQTIVLAIFVLFFGKFLTSKVPFLRNYNIPEPVSGGLIASIVFGLLYGIFDLQFEFALDVRDELLIAFFTTIGLSSRFSTLLKGGSQLGILLVLAVVYLMIQNGTGVLAATLAGYDQLVGVIGGSVSLSGGHGTAIAWTEVFRDDYGIELAGEIGIACATFGLVLGGLLGGPLARFLIERHKLEPDSDALQTVGVEHGDEMISIDYNSMMRATLVIFVAIGIGIQIDMGLEYMGVQLPTFVSCLFAGILVTNLLPVLFPRIKVPQPEQSRTLALISDLTLGLFLAISLMSLQLWTLSDLGFAILLMLVAQVVVVMLWSGIVVFRAMGSTYDAAVMSSGYIGLALGATPTAIANMTAVTKLYGPSPRAFIIVPLIGAFFIDLANSVVIQLYIGWFS
jgi:ESS family glutamate:Na+ symporter